MGAAQHKQLRSELEAACVAADPPTEVAFLGLLQRSEGALAHGDLLGPGYALIEKLIDNNDTTGRIPWLLEVCYKQLNVVVSNLVGSGNGLFPLLRIVEVVMRSVLWRAQGSTAALVGYLESATSHEISLRLCGLLMEYVARVPLSPSTTRAHYEATRLLVTMTSSALHHSTQFSEAHIDLFTETIMSSDILQPFTATLLQRVSQWGTGILPPAPEYVYKDGYQPSLLNLYNLFGAATPSKAVNVSDALGRLTAQLLGVLLAHQKGNGRNVVLEFVCGLTDGDIVAFGMLLVVFTRKLLDCPVLSMLLYVMMYDHPTFLHVAITAHAQLLLDLVVMVLQLTYQSSADDSGSSSAAVAASPQIAVKRGEAARADVVVDTAAEAAQPPTNKSAASPDPGVPRTNWVALRQRFVGFMCGTLLLIISQDQTLNQLLFRSVVDPSWRTDRFLGRTTAGSLMLIVQTKCIAHALQEHNEALAAVFVPSIQNGAIFVRDIEPFTSQRLLKLMLANVKKLRRLADSPASSSASVDAPTSPVAPGGRRKAATDGGYMEALAGHTVSIAESILAMLVGEDRRNEALVYELLYSKDMIESALGGEGQGPLMAGVRRAVQPLLRIIASYEADLASVDLGNNPSDILAVIRRVTTAHGSIVVAPPTRTGPNGGTLRQELVYVYEESPSCYDFFGPFVWATILAEMGGPTSNSWAPGSHSFRLFPQ